MYIPKLNKVEDRAEIIRFIDQYNFATVISYDDQKPVATHIPIEYELKEDDLYLKGHLARANPQWKTFDPKQEILISFMEAHSYISPSWYDYKEVPTWNYIAVHMYGKPRLFSEDELFDFVKFQMNKYESGVSSPVRPEDIEEQYLLRQLRGIVGFELKVEDIQARYKLSQNKSEKNFQNVVNHLEKSTDQNAQKIAEAMKNLKKH